MYRAYFETKMKLGEINRRSAELSTVSANLANLAAQVEHLRSLNERIRTIVVRGPRSHRRGDVNYLSRKRLKRNRARIALSWKVTDKN